MVYRASKTDIPAIVDMAIRMWEDNTIESLSHEFEEIITNEEAVVFLSMAQNQPIGFAQCSLRHDYVEGTDSSPVGYLEGIFVKPEYRRQGHAKELVKKCEEWAEAMGCSEFASDCELTNHESLAFHLGMGFTEANRIICFTKRIISS